MSRKKIYTEEFLVRATAEELRLVDELAARAKVSRSRLVIISTLSGQSALAAESFALLERMSELRMMTLIELRKARHRLERLADVMQQEQRESACDRDLGEAIKEMVETVHLLRKLWA